MMKKLIALAAVLALSGCAVPAGGLAKTPSGQLPTVADAGLRPTDPEAALRTALRQVLKDPSSLQLENIKGPAFLSEPDSLFANPAYGWWICADMNAKNSFGAYTGFHKVFVVYREGQLVGVSQEERDRPAKNAWVSNICERVERIAAY